MLYDELLFFGVLANLVPWAYQAPSAYNSGPWVGGKSSSDGRLEVWMNRKMDRWTDHSAIQLFMSWWHGLFRSWFAELIWRKPFDCYVRRAEVPESSGLSFLFQWNMAPRRDLEETFKRLDEDRSGQACDRPWLSRDNPTDQSSGESQPIAGSQVTQQK